MTTRQVYIVSGSSIDEVKIDLNRHLQAMADRLDKLEGIRGIPTLTSDGLTVTGTHVHQDSDGETIHSME